MDQTCIPMSFIKFQKIFGKFSKFTDFRPKNCHLARFSRRDFETFFDGNRIRAFKNVQIWLKISILVAYYVFNKNRDRFWMILNFGDFTGLLIFSQIGAFLKALIRFPSKKKFRNRDAKNALNGGFSAKNWPILKLKKNLLESIKTHRNTCFV